MCADGPGLILLGLRRPSLSSLGSVVADTVVQGRHGLTERQCMNLLHHILFWVSMFLGLTPDDDCTVLCTKGGIC